MRVASSSPAPRLWLLLLIIYSAYVSLGLPDGILGTAWPQIRGVFGVPLDALWLVYATGTVGGVLSSLAAGKLLGRFGVGRLLVATALLTSLCILACGLTPWFWAIIVLAFLLGLGNSATDAGLNHYVASHLSSRHMNWLHACWGIGMSSGTLILSASYSLEWGWREAYLGIGSLQGLLCLAFLRSLPLWEQFPGHSSPAHSGKEPLAPARETLRLPATWYSLALFCLYCGIEFSTGAWTTSLLEEGRQWSSERAALMVTLYWSSLTLGRFGIGWVSNRLGYRRILRGAIAGVLLGTSLLCLSSLFSQIPLGGWLTASGLLLTGLFLAPIYPTLMHDTPSCVGSGHAAHLIGWQAGAANIGISLIPGLLGSLMRHVSLELLGPCLLLLTFFFLVFFLLREKTRPRPEARLTTALSTP